MKIDQATKIITLEKTPGKIKKITGTRFAPILGLSPWSTEFEVWCDMTGTYKIPFEDNQYTIAGKAIEPKVIAYLDQKYFFGKAMLKGADQWFGKTKDELRYDHFPEQKIFGGMWDARTKDAVWELKTSKRVEDWYQHGTFDPPEYYKLQGALYAWLLNLDNFYIVLTILEDKDYDKPDKFVPTATNTIVKKFSLKEEYPYWDNLIEACMDWYNNHIIGACSPCWDETKKNDKEILKALTTSHVPVVVGKDTVSALIKKIEPLQSKIDKAMAKIEEDETALKELKEQLKAELTDNMGENDKKIDATGKLYIFEVTKAAAGGVDTDRLKKDGLYDQYKKTGFTTKFTIKRREESK